MQINNQFREKYFPIFVEKATNILRASLNITPLDAQDLASDFVVAFFYSNSLLHTFDSSKGEVEHFFASWVRRSLVSFHIRKEAQWRNFTVLEDWMKGCDQYYKYEFESWFDSIVSVLGSSVWVSGRLSVPYTRILKAATVQVLGNELWGGEVIFKELGKTLGINPSAAKRAFFSLRELLHVKQAKGLI